MSSGTAAYANTSAASTIFSKNASWNPLQEVERKDAPAKEAAPKASSSGKLTYEQKKEQEKLLRKLRKAVETIEASLADLEKKIADYDRKFAEATNTTKPTTRLTTS